MKASAQDMLQTSVSAMILSPMLCYPDYVATPETSLLAVLEIVYQNLDQLGHLFK